jgi:hypothetical protein
MSRNAEVTLDFADDTYRFRMAWGQLSQLQEACDAGPFVILGRLRGGTWKMEDISNVIRLGLIGGGLEPIKALKLVRAYVEDRPPLESHMFAVAILTAGLIGSPDEDALKKNESPKTTESGSPTSPTASSASPASTVQAQ